MKNILVLLFTFTITLLNGQISFKTDKQQFYTGERLKVELNLSYPKTAVVDSTFYRTDKVGGFEKVADSLLSRQNSGAVITEKRIWTYSAFADSGDHKFALPVFRFVNNGQTEELLSDSVTLTVKPLLSENAPAYADSLIKKVANPKDSTQIILPVKGIVKYKLSGKEKWLIFWFLVGLFIIILIIYFIMRKQKNKVAPLVEIKIKKEPAHVIALRELEALKIAKLPEKGELKEYAVRLSLIIREYLENRYEFNAAELTSHELKIESRKFLEETSISESLDNFLDNTDLIKFAKFLPDNDNMSKYFDQAIEIINKTKTDNNNKN